jgi:KDO2-lipid IV(A) lauroyltransferase
VSIPSNIYTQRRKRKRRWRKRKPGFGRKLWNSVRPHLRRLKTAVDYFEALLARLIVHGLQRLDPDTSSNFAGAFARRCGPWLPPSGTGRANLRAAFPEKSKAEIEAILAGTWENLGRVAGEFVHLDRLWDYDEAHPNAGRIETFHVDRFIGLFTDNKPALIFSAHLANWEVAALAAMKYGLDSAVLFRIPSNRFIAELIHETRASLMSRLVPADPYAVLAMAGMLQRGAHIGMLVDQHRNPGTPVTFFGRPCLASDLIARLARQYECPVHGTRVIRLPKNRFRIELSEAVTLPRDADGRIDIPGAMQTITAIVEGWVREHPEQWLWLHRRWRDE